MKIIYGKSLCQLKTAVEPITSIEIKYRGAISIKHLHREVMGRIDKRRIRVKNKDKSSVLTRGNNIITIIFNEDIVGDIDLFRWVGDFRILSVKVNNKNIASEVFGVDYWNLVNSTWNSAGKPEDYRGTYKFGRIPRKQRLRGRNIKRLSKSTTGGY